ncbi:MAG: flagellar biosynthesis protein FlhF [Lachnospiraceae bacterium]|nr:flagellar biosynthesis protein FlhF [Lachnospiraceae bacterium]
MTIKKYTGKTKEEAIEAAKAELGSQVVIMNIKEQKQKGLFGVFKAPFYEVTAAIEENDQKIFPSSGANELKSIPPISAGRHYDMRVDDEVVIPKVPENSAIYRNAPQPNPINPASNSTSGFVNEQDLKSAFREIGEMVEKEEFKSLREDPKAFLKTAPQKEEPKEEKITEPIKEERHISSQALTQSPLNGKDQKGFLKMLYNILMDNEVDERYVNQILEDLDRVISSGSSLDYLISNVYQKLVLKLGKPNVITLSENRPKVVFIIGPTGVGKTTTIAKLASKFKIDKKKNVSFITTDTYRIAATDQLRVYADILSAPLSIVYDASDFNDELSKYRDMDLVLVDTAGFSHKNQTQKDDLKKLLSTVDESYEKEIFLVLSATTKYQDLKEIVDTYREFTDFKVIFTKLDETAAYGNVLNMKLYTQADLSYVTNGQNVPDDIEVIDSQKLVKQLLGGH